MNRGLRTKSFKSSLMYKKEKVKNIHVEFRHGNEELNKPMRGVKDNGINRDVPKGFTSV